MPKPFLDWLGELIPGHPVLAAFPRIETLWSVDARRRCANPARPGAMSTRPFAVCI